jgi:hypothetical protein
VKLVLWDQRSVWNSKQRKRGWPSTNLIHQCMVSECHVVLVGHTMSPIPIM